MNANCRPKRNVTLRYVTRSLSGAKTRFAAFAIIISGAFFNCPYVFRQRHTYTPIHTHLFTYMLAHSLRRQSVGQMPLATLCRMIHRVRCVNERALILITRASLASCATGPTSDAASDGSELHFWAKVPHGVGLAVDPQSAPDSLLYFRVACLARTRVRVV